MTPKPHLLEECLCEDCVRAYVAEQVAKARVCEKHQQPLHACLVCIQETVPSVVAQAVKEEREACVNIVQEHENHGGLRCCSLITAAIRRRGEG